MPETLSLYTTLTQEICITCGCVFAIPARLQEQLIKNHQGFYCPNGHPQSYCGETEEAKLRKELRIANEYKAEYIEQRNKLQKQLNDIKERISKGVCPCCNRTFKQLTRHIKTKHPEYYKKK